jgi:hypothetical protein
MKNTAEKCLEITSLFEAEVFVRLMLWRWEHPLADDVNFANGLLEDASVVLRDAIGGTSPIEGVPATDLNFIAAVWCAEHNAVELGRADPETTAETIAAREAWL